jgi:hypothetical protein
MTGRRIDPPTWSSWSEAAAVVAHPAHLRKTTTIAVVVGTVLFCINQLDVVVRGDATPLVWAKSAVTYVVPFVVSNMGVLVGARRHDPTEGGVARQTEGGAGGANEGQQPESREGDGAS